MAQGWCENVWVLFVNCRLQWSGGSVDDCSVNLTEDSYVSHSGQVLRYTALDVACTPLLQCLGRLSLPPSKMNRSFWADY